MAEDTVKVAEDITEELDQVIPKHQLLDSTAAKHKNELVHRGTLASRHRPSGEGLRTQILRRQQADSKEGSPVRMSKELPVPPPPPPSTSTSDSKNNSFKSKPGPSFLADIQSALKTACKEDSPTEEIEEQDNDKPSEKHKGDNSPIHSPSRKPIPSFLTDIENAQRRKESGETGKTLHGKAARKVKPKATSNPIVTGKSNIQDQLRLRLEARKKLVDETDEGAETETCS